MAPKKAEPSVAMESGGSSAGWVATLSNQQNVGDMFLAYIKEASPELGGKWGAEWSEVPEKYAAAQEIFAHLATYLVNEYVSARSPSSQRAGDLVRAAAAEQEALRQVVSCGPKEPRGAP